MYLNDTIKEKFINEVSEIMIDSLDNYSDFINTTKEFSFYYELVPYHLIGYNATEKYLTENGRFSAFRIIEDYVDDYSDILGEAPKEINSEYVFQFYLDTYLGYLANEMECAELFDKDGNLNKTEATELIEYWRAQEIAELYKF